MTDPTPLTSADIEQALISDLVNGNQEKRAADKMTRKFDPRATYEVMQKIRADELAKRGPFISLRMGGRNF